MTRESHRSESRPLDQSVAAGDEDADLVTAQGVGPCEMVDAGRVARRVLQKGGSQVLDAHRAAERALLASADSRQGDHGLLPTPGPPQQDRDGRALHGHGECHRKADAWQTEAGQGVGQGQLDGGAQQSDPEQCGRSSAALEDPAERDEAGHQQQVRADAT